MDGRGSQDICGQFRHSMALIRDEDLSGESEEVKVAAAKLMALSEPLLEAMTRTNKC